MLQDNSKSCKNMQSSISNNLSSILTQLWKKKKCAKHFHLKLPRPLKVTNRTRESGRTLALPLAFLPPRTGESSYHSTTLPVPPPAKLLVPSSSAPCYDRSSTSHPMNRSLPPTPFHPTLRGQHWCRWRCLASSVQHASHFVSVVIFVVVSK